MDLIFVSCTRGYTGPKKVRLRVAISCSASAMLLCRFCSAVSLEEMGHANFNILHLGELKECVQKPCTPRGSWMNTEQYRKGRMTSGPFGLRRVPRVQTMRDRCQGWLIRRQLGHFCNVFLAACPPFSSGL